MKATFIETTGFTEAITDLLPDHAYGRLQVLLMKNPDSGDVMPGCGGLRKIRIADPKRGKGKRGGARVIYLHIPQAKRFYMIDVYGKDEQDDVSAVDKKVFRRIAQEVKAQAAAEYGIWLQENQP